MWYKENSNLKRQNLSLNYSLNWLQRHVGGYLWVTLVEVEMLLEIGFIIRVQVQAPYDGSLRKPNVIAGNRAFGADPWQP